MTNPNARWRAIEGKSEDGFATVKFKSMQDATDAGFRMIRQHMAKQDEALLYKGYFWRYL